MNPQPESPEIHGRPLAAAATIPVEATYRSLSRYQFDTDSEFQAGLSSILGHPETRATASEIRDRPDLVLQAQCFYFSRKFNTPPIDPAGYSAWKTLSSAPVDATASQEDSSGGGPVATAAAAATTSTPQPRPSRARALSTAQNLPPYQPNAQSQRSPNEPLTSTQPTAPSTSHATIDTTATAPSPTQQEQQQQQQQQQPPPYPTSFAAIVDLITNNKPIPGIEEIPETVLEHGSSKRDTTNRRRKPWEKDDVVVETIPAPAADPPSITAGTVAEAKEEKLHKMRLNREGVVHILKPDAVPDSGMIASEST